MYIFFSTTAITDIHTLLHHTNTTIAATARYGDSMTFREALLTATSNGDIDIVKVLIGSDRWKKKYLQQHFQPGVGLKPKYFD